MPHDDRVDAGNEAHSGVLHVANGTSTTRTIEAAGLPGRCSIWADPLYEGPVPGGMDDDALVAVRMEYLAGPSTSGTPDPVNDLREWRRTIARHASTDEIVLWFEHDLFDQLNLIQLLTWIHVHLPAATAVSLICIDAYPGRPAFKGLGELSAAELAPLFGRRVPVDAPMYALAARAWEAFRSPSPESLDLLRRDALDALDALPFLAAALTRFLEEYPWTTDGLSRSERRLLTLAGDGDVNTLSRLFPRMSDGERAYHVTDLTLLGMAEQLSRTAPPFLELVEDAAAQRPFQRSVRLTAAGRELLAGRRDRVTACGIDRWLGGVHLQGRGTMWRWDPAAQQIVRR